MKQKCLNKLKELTRHEHVRLTNRCNQSIFIALYIAKQIGKRQVLIADQGGWTSFKTYPRLLGLNLKKLKTDYGILDLKELEQEANEDSVLVITSFAGYFAEQPLKEISEICKKKNTLLIEDASGSIGDKELCNGSYSDIIVGSFSEWKPVNLGYGGFISTKYKELFNCKEVLSLVKVNFDYNVLLDKLNNVHNRLDFFFKKCNEIKQDLNDFEILHKGKRGLNVVVKFRDEEEKQKILEYCNKNKLEYVLCPKYIKVNEKAVSIEVKRL